MSHISAAMDGNAYLTGNNTSQSYNHSPANNLSFNNEGPGLVKEIDKVWQLQS
jgi:hypothetical protein